MKVKNETSLSSMTYKGLSFANIGPGRESEMIIILHLIRKIIPG